MQHQHLGALKQGGALAGEGDPYLPKYRVGHQVAGDSSDGARRNPVYGAFIFGMDCFREWNEAISEESKGKEKERQLKL